MNEMNITTRLFMKEIAMFNNFPSKLNEQQKTDLNTLFENYKGSFLPDGTIDQKNKENNKIQLSIIDYFKNNIPSSITPELKKEFLNNLNEIEKIIEPSSTNTPTSSNNTTTSSNTNIVLIIGILFVLALLVVLLFLFMRRKK